VHTNIRRIALKPTPSTRTSRFVDRQLPFRSRPDPDLTKLRSTKNRLHIDKQALWHRSPAGAGPDTNRSAGLHSRVVFAPEGSTCGLSSSPAAGPTCVMHRREPTSRPARRPRPRLHGAVVNTASRLNPFAPPLRLAPSASTVSRYVVFGASFPAGTASEKLVPIELRNAFE
jgi:hypothetical protein